MPTFALAIKKHTQLQIRIGSVAQLNRASDYGSEGCRFESCRSHSKEDITSCNVLFFCYIRIIFCGTRLRLRVYHKAFLLHIVLHFALKSCYIHRSISALLYRSTLL